MLGYPATQDLNPNKRSLGSLGFQDDGSQKRARTISPPSKVVHIRNLPPDGTDADILTLASPFGKVTNVLLVKSSNQAFVQMPDLLCATALMEYYSSNPISLRGHTIYFQFSTREEITAPPARGESTNSILLVTISNLLYPITIDVLHAVFSRYGHVLKIVIFSGKNATTNPGTFQALIQFADTTAAINAKTALDGQNIYVGCCSLKISFSSLSSLEVKFNNEKSRDFTNPNLPANSQSTPAGAAGGRTQLGSINPMNSLNSLSPLGGLNSLGTLGMDPYLPPNVYSPSTTSLPAGFGGMPSTASFPGQMGGMAMPAPTGNTVIICSGLAPNVTPDVLFTLFGVYGDVQIVKILYNKKDTALIQMATSQQAELAIAYLNGCNLYGTTLHVNMSKHSSVNTSRNPANEGDGSNFTKDYAASPLHRFKKAGSKNYQNICPPAPTLHISNIPASATEESMRQLFSAYGEVRAFKFFVTDHKMALVQMSTTGEAVQALIGVHNLQIDPTTPNHLRVSFAKSAITKD